MKKLTSKVHNLFIICLLIFLFNQVYYPIISPRNSVNEKQRIVPNYSVIGVIVETPINVLSGTVADIKIKMSNPNYGNIIIKDIIYTFSDYDSDTLYTSKIMCELALHDSYETNLQVRMPEVYQLYRISETDVPLTCTVAVRFTENGVEEWVYTSYNIRVFDRFLDTENTERIFNSEPMAIT